MPVTLVLNSYLFIESILPGTIQELAGEEAVPELFRVIVHGGHRILVTDRGGRKSILREYRTELQKRHLQHLLPQMTVTVSQLKAREIVSVRSNIPRIELPNLDSRHRILIEDALAANVEYLVTEWDYWLNLDENALSSGNLKIVNGLGFLNDVSPGLTSGQMEP